MKLRALLITVLALALMVPVAASTAQTGASQVGIAKKKKKKASWCAQKAKKAKARYKSKVASAKFFLYTEKRPDEYFFCSESPKYTGEIGAWEGIKKTSHLRAVKNNCAVFFSETKTGTAWDAGSKELKIISAKYFRRGSGLAKQTHGSTLGFKADTVSLESLTLSKNCVFAAGYVKNGTPTLKVAGIGDFPYQGFYEQALTGATTAELKSIKVNYVSPTAVQVSWSQAGVPKTLDYPGGIN